MAFFLFNNGVIALIRPLQVDAAAVHFYVPGGADSSALDEPWRSMHFQCAR